MADQFSRSHSLCRFCEEPLEQSFCDLGMAPPCQSQVSPANENKAEAFYALHAFVCRKCLLVQIPEYVSPKDIFTEYAYFSSFSDSWLKHVKAYSDKMVERFGFGSKSRVIELASNDGYLLQWFKEKGVPVLGVEPAANVAQAAIKKGIPTVVKFFGRKTAEEVAVEHGKADLLLGNNVLAHVPDLMDFVGGMKILLKPDGIITMEFPHLLQLMDQNQFDTIYHEHFSYFSFTVAEKVFASHGLTLFDVEELPTHGGSLRIYGRHSQDASKPVGPRVSELKAKEEKAGLNKLEGYLSFGEKVKETKRQVLDFLIRAKRDGKTIVQYGAAGKANTLLNYCGIRNDFMEYAVDRNPYKQGHYLPGSRIPVYPPDRIRETQPDYLFIGVWNLKDEIVSQTSYIREWGGKWIVPIPHVTVVD
ncbi:MAG TPA: class I SAM-dependent methyltransferase [Fibrobacteria bacterium]|nr:class I SAM-dependent methyltransferase [Fibrobacteria bacterium]